MAAAAEAAGAEMATVSLLRCKLSMRVLKYGDRSIIGAAVAVVSSCWILLSAAALLAAGGRGGAALLSSASTATAGAAAANALLSCSNADMLIVIKSGY